jgi:hypothetical protein
MQCPCIEEATHGDEAAQEELSQMYIEIDRLRAENEALRKLVRDCQDDLARWIVPDSGITDDDVINKLLDRLDGPQARAALRGEGGE